MSNSFSIELKVKPKKLQRVTADLERRASIIERPVIADAQIEDAIVEFLSDSNRLNKDIFIAKWWKRRRYLRWFLSYYSDWNEDIDNLTKRRLTAFYPFSPFF